MEYTKFGKIDLNNPTCLSRSNILQRAHQWARFRMKMHLGVTLARALYHMCKSGQFILKFNLYDSIEVGMHGCEGCGFNME